jgi:hypothetical protein
MITLTKVTEEGEQIVAIGNTYKQILDQLLGSIEEDAAANGITYKLNPDDSIYEGKIEEWKADEPEQLTEGGQDEEQ